MSTRVLTRFVRSSGQKNASGRCEIPEPQLPTCCLPRTPAAAAARAAVQAAAAGDKQSPAQPAQPTQQSLAQRLLTPKLGSQRSQPQQLSTTAAMATHFAIATPHQRHHHQQQQRAISSSYENTLQRLTAVAEAAKGGVCDKPDPHPPPCGVRRAPTRQCPAESREKDLLPNANRQKKCPAGKKPWRKPDCVETAAEAAANARE